MNKFTDTLQVFQMNLFLHLFCSINWGNNCNVIYEVYKLQIKFKVLTYPFLHIAAVPALWASILPVSLRLPLSFAFNEKIARII